ncbi:MAG: M48 family peptidase [Candidatus Hydrogenedentes bacterium]|nr:M48 family peptidase [Candidatus Hydrogenedentota bacterium]
MHLYGIHTEEVAQRIVTAFQQPETLPKALAPIFIHRKDDVPCRKWSWHNQLIAALSGTTDARGMRQWNEAGRKIRPGSKAIWILAPCLKTIRDKNDQGEEVQRSALFGFRSVPVFAIEDTSGSPLPVSDDCYNSWLQELPLLEVAKSWNIMVGTYSGTGASALGYFQRSASGQAIMLGVENRSTWAHELTHAADDRINGLQEPKWHREIVAELGGAILLECLGLTHESDLGGAYEYIQRYAEDAKKDLVKACIEVLDRVCNCVKLILDTAESAASTAATATLSASA